MEFGNNKYISKVVRLLETLIIVQLDIIVKKKLIRKIRNAGVSFSAQKNAQSPRVYSCKI